jgi:hypothetical protein
MWAGKQGNRRNRWKCSMSLFTPDTHSYFYIGARNLYLSLLKLFTAILESTHIDSWEFHNCNITERIGILSLRSFSRDSVCRAPCAICKMGGETQYKLLFELLGVRFSHRGLGGAIDSTNRSVRDPRDTAHNVHSGPAEWQRVHGAS